MEELELAVGSYRHRAIADGPPDGELVPLEEQDRRSWDAASVSEGAIYAVTHVDVIPPTKDECVVMLKKLAEDTRKEPNAERFEAWVQNNRANHFTVMEVWKNRAAHDAHIATASTKDFREKLGPMSGAL